jgi:hypothetical protein
VLGQGGLIDAGVGIIEDLQAGGVAGIVGALQKAGTAYNTFKDKNIRSTVNQEVKDSATAILKGSLPAATRAAIGTTSTSSSPGQRGLLDGIFFPTPGPTDARLPAPTSTEVLTQAQRNATIARR